MTREDLEPYIDCEMRLTHHGQHLVTGKLVDVGNRFAVVKQSHEPVYVKALDDISGARVIKQCIVYLGDSR